MVAILSFAVCASLLLPRRSAAQGTPEIAGTVVDSASGIGIALADLSLDGRAAHVLTDERGGFRLATSGAPMTLRIRRLGFEPRTVTVTAAQSRATLTVRLVPSTRYLDAVVVNAQRTKYSGRLAGYYSRLERRTQGQFITRADLEREHPTQLTDMLQRQPGVRITRGRPGAQSVRLRGRECRPLVWLDGTAMPAGDVDLDSFSPASLEGIELYLSSSPPAGFQAARGQSECGTVLLWSRGTDTEPRRGNLATPAELEELLTSLLVFSPDQVDIRAALDSTARWVVAYPPSLRASGTSGRVVAEFVVDTLGRVEQSHFGIVSSTDPLFSMAVRESASSARFSPARRGRQRVRQLVRLPFDFHPGSREP
jgi:TonB family protein